MLSTAPSASMRRGQPKRLRRSVGLALLCACGMSGTAAARVSFPCETGVPVADMMLFDAHDHLRVSSQAEAIANLDALAAEGVAAGMLALGTPDSEDLAITIALQQASPYAVFAFVNPPAVLDGMGEKTFDETTLAEVQTQLDAGAFGIGEVSLRHSGPPALGADIPADDPGALALYAEASTRDVRVTIHFETREKSAPTVDLASRVDELRNALAAYPDTLFIWSHLGDTGPATVRSLIEEFDNLYADISTRNPYYERGWPVTLQSLGSGPSGLGGIKPAWKDLFEDHPDRFLFGLDLASSERWDQLSDVVSFYRSILGELDPATAERIACTNAQVLLAATSVPGLAFPTLGGLVVALIGGAWLAAKRGARSV